MEHNRAKNTNLELPNQLPQRNTITVPSRIRTLASHRDTLKALSRALCR